MPTFGVRCTFKFADGTENFEGTRWQEAPNAEAALNIVQKQIEDQHKDDVSLPEATAVVLHAAEKLTNDPAAQKNQDCSAPVKDEAEATMTSCRCIRPALVSVL